MQGSGLTWYLYKVRGISHSSRLRIHWESSLAICIGCIQRKVGYIGSNQNGSAPTPSVETARETDDHGGGGSAETLATTSGDCLHGARQRAPGEEATGDHSAPRASARRGPRLPRRCSGLRARPCDRAHCAVQDRRIGDRRRQGALPGPGDEAALQHGGASYCH